MCCAGCKAVSEIITAAGLEGYYRSRVRAPSGGAERVPRALALAARVASPTLQDQITHTLSDGTREAHLILTDLDCAACAWLVENRVAALPGVVEASVNYATHRLLTRYCGETTQLAAIVNEIARLGYQASPYDPTRQEQLLRDERRQRLRSLSIAGLLSAQIMMAAVALYGGHWWGIEAHLETWLRWFSLALCVPTFGYCALPFHRGAWRSVMNRAPSMDVPVSLGLTIAFTMSLTSTVTGHGEVYFDSVAMFTFALLVARYFEVVARHHGQRRSEALITPMPETAHRLMNGGDIETVPLAALAPGDKLQVLMGESVPADGILLSAHANIDASLLSGESRPQQCGGGDALTGGTINVGDSLWMRVTRVGPDTVVSTIMALVERARSLRPPIQQLADRIASSFVVAVVLGALLVALGHAALASPGSDVSVWIAPTIAVLVVSCPCALSLATPSALTAATTLLTRTSIVPVAALDVETLARVNHVVLDKTGTLTEAELTLDGVHPLASAPVQRYRQIAGAIEVSSNHPIARALRASAAAPMPLATHVHVTTGRGIEAYVNGNRWWLGTPQWVQQMSKLSAEHHIQQLERDGATVVMLANGDGDGALFALRDRVRPQALQAVQALRARGLRLTLLSGDRNAAVSHTGQTLGIDHYHGELMPQDKLQFVREYQRRGDIVLAVGDGTNDAPVLAGADASVAMANGTQFARASADFIALANDLHAIDAVLAIAKATRRTIRGNVIWAIGYNALALPFAAVGLVPPWLAAIGMSLSSLVVVLASLSLHRRHWPGAG